MTHYNHDYNENSNCEGDIVLAFYVNWLILW